MEKACRLLAYTTKELAQIALECGYCDQSYFTRVFRRTQACTPGEYRKARAAG
jgi:AraC-like DNA-binding protein